jgi:hypothetical protein
MLIRLDLLRTPRQPRKAAVRLQENYVGRETSQRRALTVRRGVAVVVVALIDRWV